MDENARLLRSRRAVCRYLLQMPDFSEIGALCNVGNVNYLLDRLRRSRAFVAHIVPAHPDFGEVEHFVQTIGKALPKPYNDLPFSYNKGAADYHYSEKQITFVF